MDRVQTSRELAEKEKIQDLTERYKESSITVRRTMILLFTFSIFCLSVLFVPDDYLFPHLGKVIKLTLFSLPLSADAFIFISPVFLMAITSYLNIFLNELDSMNTLAEQKKFPVLLTLNIRAINLLRKYICLYNVPVIMLLYCWVISPHPNAPYFFGFTCFIIIFTIYKILSGKPGIIFWRFTAFLLALNIIAITVHSIMQINRGFNLERITVDASVNLSGLDFGNISLKYSDLESVNLGGSNLQNANLVSANLKNANLSNANLKGANLLNTNLKNVDLSNAKLSDADFKNTIIIGADMNKVDFYATTSDNTKEPKKSLSIINLKCEQLKTAKNVPIYLLNEVCK